MPEPIKWHSDVRVFYEKTGMAKFISHLDTVHLFTRAIKRAKIPIWFTEGFNPHAFLTFAMPLSLGTESYCETVDIRLMQEEDLDELASRFDAALPSDVHITKIALPKFSPQEIAWADYKIIFNGADENLVSRAKEILSSDEITVMKKVKQGKAKVEKEVSIKDKILKFSIDTENENPVLNITLSSGMQNNINPSLIIGKIVEGSSTDADSASIFKLKSYTADLSEWQ
ncbi:MAG: TIGR03936 family radical SAM-associated protein [Oscillospiraceae bacterium]|nr:TIGR03936 family radical SAM-associated protein [Oscillospiraceae bacterium]